VSATSAACHSRAAASHWAMTGRAVRAMCVAQPVAWRADRSLEALRADRSLEALRADRSQRGELRGRQDGALTLPLHG